MQLFRDLLETFGGPLYVYQLDRAEAALRDLRAALPQPSRLYYSAKANPHPDLIRALHEAGCGVEVSSEGEAGAAVAAGAAPGDCLYTGPAKTEAEIALALRGGIRLFSAESAADLGRVSRAAGPAGVTARCLLRVNPPAAGAATLRMAGGASQFGTSLDSVLAERPWRRPPPGTEVAGLHFFPLSNVRDPASLLDAFTVSIDAAATLREAAGFRFSLVDLGGGFAAPYAAPGERPGYGALGDELSAVLDDRLPGWRDGDPQVAFESGRYLVGDCGSLVCTAMELRGDFLLLDSGINHLGGLGGLGRLLRPTATPAGPVPGGAAQVTIAGPLCTPADVLARGVRAGHIAAGTPVVFPNVGAYGLTASLLGFLSRPAPAEVVLRGEEIVSATRLNLVRSRLV